MEKNVSHNIFATSLDAALENHSHINAIKYKILLNHFSSDTTLSKYLEKFKTYCSKIKKKF